ncbi:MAG TPA: di-heme oxidoredictase family protein [Terriglobia bacterium]|nr:di-heme oxidoredictase family protein [Terriglobia bacterium]
MPVKPGRAVRLSIPTTIGVIFAAFCALEAVTFALSQKDSVKSFQAVTDPGVRGGGPGAGGALPGLSTAQTQTFKDGQTNFETTYSVPTGGSTAGGLGPAFNSNSCSSCHMQPAYGGGTAYDLTGGTVTQNPLFGVYQLNGATNTMPFFETTNGPELIARFPDIPNTTTPDGSVHQLFTITGRTDAKGCNLGQPTFSANNIAYRQPLGTFGDGLIEIIENITILNQAGAECASQSQTGVCGIASIDEHTGDVNRLGWKGQWRGLIMAAAEEMNVELGVTNEYFPAEVNQTVPACLLNPIPEDGTNFTPTIQFDQFTGAVERMAIFMGLTAPPAPATFNSRAIQGQTDFENIGCTNCHLAQYTTAPNASMGTFMSNKTITLYSDLLLHHMGNCLADNIVQGTAQGDMFRTPPLWGAGKRVFFMHDGRTSNILTAIEDHVFNGAQGVTCSGSYQASEATNAVNAFNALGASDQQDVLDFLRDL